MRDGQFSCSQVVPNRIYTWNYTGFVPEVITVQHRNEGRMKSEILLSLKEYD